MRLKLQYSDEWITLAPTPFAGGGEGNLYHIVHPRHWSRYVAKVYHPHKRTPERAKKISYLAKYPPELASNRGEHPSVIWVKDALHDNQGTFVGLIMPFIQGEKLEILCTPKIPKKLRQTWSRFSFKRSKSALEMRLKLSFNICAAIHQIHDANRYVLVDMKPDNIVIQPNGLVAIVDTDSVEVVENGETLFDAPVATPEYSPPEHYRTEENDPTQQQTWDCFGLGVILYKLLFGIHPFAASAHAPYDHLVSLDDKIKAGLFVHTPDLRDTFRVIPPLHQAFYDLDPSLQELFLRCFVAGHTDPTARPSAEEWCATLLYVMDDAAAIQRFGHILGIGQSPALHRPRFQPPSRKIGVSVYQPKLNGVLGQDEKSIQQLTPHYIPVNPNHEVVFDKDDIQWSRVALIAMGFFGVLVSGVLGGPLLPFIVLVAFFYNAYQKTKITQNRINANKHFKVEKERYRRVKKRALGAQRAYAKILGKAYGEIEALGGTISEKVSELEAYLKKQDQRVAKIEAEAMEIYQHLMKKYHQLALKDRFVARIATSDQQDSITKIRIEINKNYQQAIANLTKKVSLEKESTTYREGKIAVDQLISSKRIAIEDLLEQKKQSILDQPDEYLEKRKIALRQAADINLNIKRIWSKKWYVPASQKKRIIETLASVGLESILQIKRIDVEDKYIRLRNGKRIKIRDKTYLRSLLQWQDEIKHLKTTYTALKREVEQKKKVAIESLEQSSRIEIGGLKTEERQQLKELAVVAHKELLGDAYAAVEQQYETATEHIEQLELAQKEEQEVLMEQLQMEYDQLMAVTEKRVEEIKKEIAPLEAKLKRLEQNLNAPKVRQQYRAVEKQLQYLKSTINELQQAKYEKERHKKVTFINYIAKLVRIR